MHCVIVKGPLGEPVCFSYNLFGMRKDAPLAFRITGNLKKKLMRIAKREGRSLSQVCEMLLRIGAEEYDRSGPGYLQRNLSEPHDNKLQ